MYEPWVMNIDLSTIAFSSSDPDHPIVEKLSKTSTKQERTGIAMVTIVQSTDCPRGMFANYLGDKTPNGRLLFLIINDLVTNFDSSTIYNALVLQSTLRACVLKQILCWAILLSGYRDRRFVLQYARQLSRQQN